MACSQTPVWQDRRRPRRATEPRRTTHEMATASNTVSAISNPQRAARPRIAVASSGLGHINRGIETWAADLSAALRRTGEEVTLFQAAGKPTEAWQVVLNCRRRFDPDTERLVQGLSRLGGWRYGYGSGYQAEQTSFARLLWPFVRSKFDILHVQDPWLALILDRLHRSGLSRAKVILAHGTEEPPAFLRRCSVLQHLAPNYLEEWRTHQPRGQQVFAVPNFVDTARFQPGDQAAARAIWGIPRDALVVLCVAAIKKHHKRVDYLIQEFASLRRFAGRRTVLVVAGGREQETDDIIAQGKALLGEDVLFLEGLDRIKMPRLYQAADLFCLASLHEMMPIAVLEALSSGLPVACNDTPTLRWMVGDAGEPSDLSLQGALAEQLRRLSQPERRQVFSARARVRAEQAFSEAAVLGQVLSMYATVLETR
jgi:1,2-diacylglycerol 3-alpha-glucosyltransferase